MSLQIHTDNLFNSSGCLTLSALERYRDKQLGAKEQERVHEHLAGCMMCRDALEGLIMLPAGSSARPEIRDVNARLRKKYRYTPAGARDEKKGPRISQWIIPAAASIILLAGIIGYFNYFLPKTQELAMAETEEVISPAQGEKELAPEQPPITQQDRNIVAAEQDNLVVENTDKVLEEEFATSPSTAVRGISGEESRQAGAGAIADRDAAIITVFEDDSTVGEIAFGKTDDEVLAMTVKEITIEAPSPSMARMEDDKGYMMEEGVDATEINQKAGKSESRAKGRTEEEVQEGDPIFTVVEDMPEFPGGEDSLYRFIRTNFILPYDSTGQYAGKTYVSFIVNQDGSISHISILRGPWDAFNKEAIRVIEMMPAWVPGKQRGQPVAVQMILPFNYIFE